MDEAAPVIFGLVEPARLAAMSGLDVLRGILDRSLPAPPFAETVEIEPVFVEEGRVVFSGRPSRRFYNPMGTVHGGWIAMLLDTAMGCAVHSSLPSGYAYSTVDMATTFVRPLREEGGLVTCEAVLLRRGTQIATAEGKVYDGRRRLVAHGSETCLVRPVAAATHP